MGNEESGGEGKEGKEKRKMGKEEGKEERKRRRDSMASDVSLVLKPWYIRFEKDISILLPLRGRKRGEGGRKRGRREEKRIGGRRGRGERGEKETYQDKQ